MQDAVERWPRDCSHARVAYRPVRFSRTEKLTAADRLALAFDALAVADVVGQTPSNGRIVYGPRCAVHTVPLTKEIAKARRLLKAAEAVLANAAPPPLALNKHCAVCEVQSRCHKAAVERDDLSLLATMSAKARKKQNSKGIFTVAQRVVVTGRAQRQDTGLDDTWMTLGGNGEQRSL